MNFTAYCCSVLMLGMLCGIKLPTIKLCTLGICVLSVVILKFLIFYKSRKKMLPVLVIAIIFFGGAVFGFSYDRYQFKELNSMYGTTVTLTGTVVQIGENSFELDDGKRSWEISIVDEFATVSKYDIVTVTGDLSAVRVAAYKGDTDMRLYKALRGIYGKMYPETLTIIGRDTDISIRKIGTAIRDFINNRIDEVHYYKDKGFIKALLTGDTTWVSSDTKESFKLTGISHLLAVSGLHFGIFLSFFSVITGHMRHRKISGNLLIILLVILYIVMVGERASVLRSGIMIVLSYVLRSFSRRSDSVINLMFAGIGICIVNPYYVSDPGFQMSFFATLGIVLYQGFFKHKFIAIPAISTLFLMPVTTYYNNVLSLESVLVNIVSVFMIPVVILIGYLSCIFPVLGAVANIPAQIILYISQVMADLSFFHIDVPSSGILLFAMWFLFSYAVYFALDGFRVDDILIVLACALLLGSYMHANEFDVQKHTVVNFINIGTYNMEHIQTENNKDILIDCGFNAPSYLVKNGVDDIYAIMITNDNKYRYSGLEETCRKYNVQAVLLPDSMKDIKLNLENSRIIYYNQNSYNHAVDGIKISSLKIKDINCLRINVYGKVISVPVGTRRIKEASGSTVISVPDNCTDCDEVAADGGAQIFVHSTYNYDYYDYGSKYITAQEGMVSIIFHRYKLPFVKIG